MNDNNIVGTSCRYCTFRVNDDNGKQIGCELGFDQDYTIQTEQPDLMNQELALAAGFPLIPVESEKDEFWQKNKVCMHHRYPGWKDKKYNLEDGTYLQATTKEIIDAFDKSLTLVIYAMPEHTLENIKYTIKSLDNLKRKPKKVLILNNAKIKPILFLSLNNETNFKWSMEYILEENVSKDRLIDIGSKKTDTALFFDIEAGKQVSDSFLQSAVDAIIDGSSAFVLMKSEYSNLYYTRLYRMMGGNKDMPFEEKLKKEVEEQKCQNVVKIYQE